MGHCKKVSAGYTVGPSRIREPTTKQIESDEPILLFSSCLHCNESENTEKWGIVRRCRLATRQVESENQRPKQIESDEPILLFSSCLHYNESGDTEKWGIVRRCRLATRQVESENQRPNKSNLMSQSCCFRVVCTATSLAIPKSGAL